ncbi:hypothetical protein N7520_008690 [Penicillium odoratum]|uniref:uncharacterized protein n=1 Tax=Penicillium odoratum TaxID=1167516 RepID=UPI0025483F17|nr:uncharacterized protein N7520_008690 [Penicillium odoratum]KAJ5751773.1 hypothetical protein N7520_008690 [Penicillium odoratum]
MPSSMALSETRTLASGNGRSLNAAPRLSESKTVDDRPRNDDVFLNIARSDSESGRRQSLGRSDFRRSRLGNSIGSLRSPTARDEEYTPSPEHRPNKFDPLHSQNGSSSLPYGSIPPSPAASAHPLDDSNRFRYSSLTSGARSTIGAPRSRLGRISPETSPRSPAVSRDRGSRERSASLHESRFHRISGLSTVRSSRQASASEATERGQDDAEKSRDESGSNLSTTAPSTVWDQLDDLKSRIRKLEVTGKLPPSSQAAILGNERPRTAATTVTAMSTSPRHHRKASNPSMEIESVQNQVHPILQSALAKAKMVLSNDVYAALEVTITDALALSTVLGANAAPSGSVSVVNGGYSSPERHARRKADSVCRSLTELCLALTDAELKRCRPSSSQGPASQPRVNGSDVDSLRPTSSYRATSHEPESVERRPSTNRISSRLEARRASVANPSPSTEPKPAQSPNLPTPPSRLHRISTSLRNRRVPTEEFVETPNPNSRSLSRAVTEVATPSPAQSVSPRQRFSYGPSTTRSISTVKPDQGLGISPRSPQYPPSTPQAPASQPRTPSTLSQSGIPSHTAMSSQSGIPFRRSYMTPGVYSPATSRSNIQAGSRRYGLSPGIEENPRPQLEPSQTRISVPSGKSVTSYTPIQQPRLRTNSLGSRKFALRRRSAVMPDDAFNLDDSID